MVRRYLDALQLHQAASSRRKTTDTIRRSLDATLAQLELSQTPTKRLGLIQRRMDLEAELRDAEQRSTVDVSGLEEAFVGVASEYSEAKGISWPAWREVGVPAEVLRRGGVVRTRM